MFVFVGIFTYLKMF